MTVGQRIKQARKNKGLSQHGLAAMTHVSQPTVANWENDSHAPRNNALSRIAKALDSSPAWILGESETLLVKHHYAPVLGWPESEGDLNTGQVSHYIPAMVTARRPFALRINDPEMASTFTPGTLLVLDRGDTNLTDGAAYLIKCDEGLCLRIFSSLQNGLITTPKNGPSTITIAQDILARAVMAISEL